jgi:hypothetical protein
MNQEWDLKGRSHNCTATGRPFADGEAFYTLLFHEAGGWRREDLSEEAWQGRNDNIQPFSFWRSKYQAPPPPAPDALPQQSAEDLLRQFLLESDATHSNARYILALMLERKRLLKQVEARDTAGGRILIYEHARSGEVFLIPDPQLRLEQVEEVQAEVAALLGARAPGTPAPAPAPATDANKSAPAAAPSPETA